MVLTAVTVYHKWAGVQVDVPEPVTFEAVALKAAGVSPLLTLIARGGSRGTPPGRQTLTDFGLTFQGTFLDKNEEV